MSPCVCIYTAYEEAVVDMIASNSHLLLFLMCMSLLIYTHFLGSTTKA